MAGRSESGAISGPSSASQSSLRTQSTLPTSIESGDITDTKLPGSQSSGSPLVSPGVNTLGFDRGPFPEQLWLLACAEQQKFATVLEHLDVNSQKIKSDKDLALLVKSQYTNLRSSWRQFLRLRGLSTIQFVQVSIHLELGCEYSG
jgi:hypothetical protein